MRRTRSLTTRARARRTAAAGAVALFAVTGLAACGNDDSGDPETASGTTSETSSAVPTPDEGETIDPAEFVDDVLGSMTDLTTAHMTMAMEGGPAEMEMEGDVDYTTTPPDVAMTMNSSMMSMGKDSETEVRMVDGVMYMQLPIGDSDKWIKLDLDGAGSPLNGDLLEQMNPSAQLERMKDAVTEVEYVGEDDYGQHYTLTVRTEAFRDLEEQLGGSGAGAELPAALDYDLWTDDDGLLTRSETALGELGSVTMTLSEWGEDVEIEAPPASDVVEMPKGSFPGSEPSA